MIELLARKIYAGRKIIIIVTMLITVIFLFFTARIRINPDITTYLPKNDKAVKLFNYIGQEFGGNLIALVVLESENIFDKQTMENIGYLTKEFQLIEGVSYVNSLTNILDIKTSDDGIEVGRLIDENNMPATEEEYRVLRDYALGKKMYRGNVISEDGTAALIICRLDHDADKIKTAREIMLAVRRICPHEKLYYGGFPFLMLDISSTVINDLLLLTPLVTLVIVLILGFSFRSLRGIFAPLMTALISIIWTMGLMGMTGLKLAIISDIIPVILFAVGTAYSIHVLNCFDENRDREIPDKINSFARIIVPVFLAAITTMFGFISFIFGSYLTMIQEFGLFAAIGVMFSLIISLTFVPAFLFTLPAARQLIGDRKGMTLPGIKIAGRPLIVILAAGILLIIAIIGIPRIQRKIDLLDYFKAETNIRRSEEIIKKKFGGSMPIQILVKGDITDPAVLRSIKDLEDFLESHDDIKNTQSIADLLMETSFCIGEGKVIPDSKAKVNNLWFLLEGEEIMGQLVNTQRDEAVIQSSLQSGMETHRVDELVTEINNYLEIHRTDQFVFEQTGMPTIHQQLDRSVKKSQFRSIIVAAILIFIVLLFMLRSIYAGLIGIIPIAFSLVIVFGAMGFFGIPLDIATVLIGSVGIGIGIDYAIHFLSRFKYEKQQEQDIKGAVINTINSTGRAIIINMLTVALGFLVLLLANLVPLQRFGVLVTITMISSGLSTVIIIPSVLIITMNKKEKEKK